MIRDVKTVILNDSDIFHLPFNTLEHNNVYAPSHSTDKQLLDNQILNQY